MLVFDDRRLMILTPPHTASGVLHSVCRHWGAHYVIGPTPDGEGFDQHTTAMANGWVGYATAVVVRHPCARLAGLWHHHSWFCATQGWQELTLAEYVEAVAGDDERLSWFYKWPLRRWIGRRRFEIVLNLETIEADLTAILGAPFKMPPLVETHRPWQADWEPRFTTVLESWLADERI